MSAESLTADDDDAPFWERMIGLHERLLQSGFITDEQTRADVERMISMLRAVAEIRP